MEKHPALVSDLAWIVGVPLFPCVLQAQEVHLRFEEYKKVLPPASTRTSSDFSELALRLV